MQVQFVKYFESIFKNAQEENAQNKITILHKHKILLISGSETFINPTIINEEFNGIPSVKDMPLLIKNILSELNKMETFKSWNDFSIWVRKNFYSFVDTININLSEDETIFVDYIFDVLLHFKAVEYRQTVKSLESWPKAIKMDASWEINGFDTKTHFS
ncbi:12225_t:CDS:2 [Gigaspora margarita]|uniref:12225_t:CDS:1 n=1 Tax=Gigaspora margarita TaxID=4874 RepID=A0ABN7ULM5_GIGMA|nr:12225_t:CDS:2 [Gigaspora margarita]